MHALALFDDPLFSEHRPDGPHPECPERLDAARAGLLKSEPHGLPRLRLSARDASDDELGRVHDERYLVSLGQAAGKHGYLDPDTYFGPQSVAAARRAAGAAAQMVEALLDEQAGFGLALLRPRVTTHDPTAPWGSACSTTWRLQRPMRAPVAPSEC